MTDDSGFGDLHVATVVVNVQDMRQWPCLKLI
jgi:hypothetical protein